MEVQSQDAAIPATELQQGPLRGYVAGTVYILFFVAMQLTAGFLVMCYVRCALLALIKNFCFSFLVKKNSRAWYWYWYMFHVACCVLRVACIVGLGSRIEIKKSSFLAGGCGMCPLSMFSAGGLKARGGGGGGAGSVGLFVFFEQPAATGTGGGLRRPVV